MLYLLGRIALFQQVTARLAALLAAINAAAATDGEAARPDAGVAELAQECYVRAGAAATLAECRAAAIDALLDLAHQLQSLEEDIRYEKKRLSQGELAELRDSYWIARNAIKDVLDDIACRGHRKIPKLNPDPFDDGLDLGLF